MEKQRPGARSASFMHSKPMQQTKMFAVWHCKQQVYTNTAAALCHAFIKQHNLKNAKVGYAKA